MRILKIVKPGKAFQVSYRIKDKSTAQGTSQERYDDLVGRLEKLKAVRRSRHFDDQAHTATSSWIVRSSESTAEDLATKLGRNLTPGVDLLEVIEVVPANWHRLTKWQACANLAGRSWPTCPYRRDPAAMRAWPPRIPTLLNPAQSRRRS